MFFFFFKQKTAYEMRISDWSSDVCSSDPEERGKAGLSAAELVHGVPHARFINASFAYAKPREPMRFSPADRGAWYAALAAETCLAEVGFHLTRALADAGDFHAVVEFEIGRAHV